MRVGCSRSLSLSLCYSSTLGQGYKAWGLRDPDSLGQWRWRWRHESCELGREVVAPRRGFLLVVELCWWELAAGFWRKDWSTPLPLPLLLCDEINGTIDRSNPFFSLPPSLSLSFAWFFCSISHKYPKIYGRTNTAQHANKHTFPGCWEKSSWRILSVVRDEWAEFRRIVSICVKI